MMNTRVFLSGAAALLCAGALNTSAQIAPKGGTQQRPPQPTTQQPRASAPADDAVMTLTGCLYREQDIPGASPNAAERAGVGEDYVLADATTPNQQRSGGLGSPIAGGDRPGTGAPGAPTATAGLATGRMYKVKKLEDDRLRALVGKRVEVSGIVKAADPDSRSDRGRSLDNIPDIEATSAREVAGVNCPPSPPGSSPSASPSGPGTAPNRE